jgi:hypothetical protein
MKINKIHIALLSCLLLSAGVWALQLTSVEKKKPVTSAWASSTQAPDGAYQLGERLSQTKSEPSLSTAPITDFKETDWEALVPKNWDPMKAFKGIDMNFLNDADPRAMVALEKMREAWDSAPIEPSMNGKKIRIPGFIVPLDAERGQIKQFLLVPYFGGCLHTPPPPANQIIDVTSRMPIKMQSMDAVWVTGILVTKRSDTEMGSAGYSMSAVKVTPYVHSKTPAKKKK